MTAASLRQSILSILAPLAIGGMADDAARMFRRAWPSMQDNIPAKALDAGMWGIRKRLQIRFQKKLHELPPGKLRSVVEGYANPRGRLLAKGVGWTAGIPSQTIDFMYLIGDACFTFPKECMDAATRSAAIQLYKEAVKASGSKEYRRDCVNILATRPPAGFYVANLDWYSRKQNCEVIRSFAGKPIPSAFLK